MTSSFDAHRERRELFGTDAAAYAAGRPGYPDRVFDLLRERCRLGPGSRVIEIGPGTGQATRHLIDTGASVTAVELSPELAQRLRGTCPDPELTVEVGAFEDVTLEPASADLIVSATAFHWVPPERGVPRCADLLGVGGHLALWWNVYGDPDRPDSFHEALTPLLERTAPSLLEVPGAGNPHTGSPPYPLDTDARMAEIRAGGRFDDVYHERVAWTGRHSAAQLRALFSSFSPWLSLPEAQRKRSLDALEELAIDEFGGTVDRPYLTPIYIARRIADPWMPERPHST